MTELQLAMGQQFGWTARFLVRLREDRVYFSIIGVFFALTAGLDRLTDHSYLLETTYAYLNFWMAVALTMFAAALSMQFVSRAVRDRHERPFELLYDVLKFIFTPETVRRPDSIGRAYCLHGRFHRRKVGVADPE
ncbi:MAG: hypothetical protein WDN29_06205 [Methylovirgula sp.]